jgi:hypothetical protein
MPTDTPLGQDLSGFNPSVFCFGLSINLTECVQFIGVQLSTFRVNICGHDDAVFPPPPPPEYDLAGFYQELFGSQLFERVILIPSVEKLGFVITDTQFPVEVWNTRRNVADILTSVNVLGVGDLIVTNPFPLPTYYGALCSRIYQVIVNRTGAPTINAEICFGFVSGIAGTCILITGNRIVLFSPRIDWNSGFKERISYLSNVFKSYSDVEQRRALRQLARRSSTFRAAGLSAREAATIESQIWGWQNQPYGIPWWPDVSPLTVDAPIGSTQIFCDTTDRQFAAGGIACVWKDPFTFEALSVTAVAPNSITVASPTQLLWKANPATVAMPVFLGRLPLSVDVNRLFSGADQMEMVFSGEASQLAPAPMHALTQYRGFDVLEIPAHWPTDLKRKYTRSMISIDPEVGPITVIDQGGAPYISQPFPMLILSHAEVTKLRAFILARFGRLRPFWLPTWDQDLVLSQDLNAADTGIKIQSEFYTRFMFPNRARRFVALIPTDSSGNIYHQITSSVDNGDGTETLQFESPIGRDMKAARTMVSFLVFARLNSDDTEIDWLSNDVAEATLEFQELPKEVP